MSGRRMRTKVWKVLGSVAVRVGSHHSACTVARLPEVCELAWHDLFQALGMTCQTWRSHLALHSTPYHRGGDGLY